MPEMSDKASRLASASATFASRDVGPRVHKNRGASHREHAVACLSCTAVTNGLQHVTQAHLQYSSF